MQIKKSKGVTETENYLAELCNRTFLNLWSYPNPYKDDGDEFCDLLVIFENNIFIFFDREKNLKNNKDDEQLFTNWSRWYRKVICNQERTSHGAEKYLKRNGQLYLDSKKEKKFPIDFDILRCKVYKIIIAHGAELACKTSSSQNVYGSLAISYSKREFHKEKEISTPFLVYLNSENPIHVFDSANLDIIFNELDTISDFVSYLDAKEIAINKYDSLMYCGEEDLLAHYYLNFDEKENKHYIGTRDQGINAIYIGEGEWNDFIKTPAYKSKKEADKDSYLWDRLLQYSGNFVILGTSRGNADHFSGYSPLKEMAKEPRVQRRILSKVISEAIDTFPHNPATPQKKMSFIQSATTRTGYVFLQLMNLGYDYEEYRLVRQKVLEVACGSAKNKFNEIRKIVGIACEPPKISKKVSEDFLLMNFEDWSEEDKNYYIDLNGQGGLNFFGSTGKKIFEKFKEFPDERLR